MLSYPYLEELFKSVLVKSKVIQGRFYLCPMYGSELNELNVGDILKRAGLDTKSKYPLCIMLPPVNHPDYLKTPQRDRYEVELVFLTKTGVASTGEVKAPAGDGKSSHTVPQDWHDMKRCADDFYKMLDLVVQNTDLKKYFYLSGKDNGAEIVPVSNIGDDKVSGVKLSFPCGIYSSCAIDDYAPGAEATIQYPTTDSHPSHFH